MVKISTNIKNFIETITKGLFYTKTETDTKLDGKANSSHSHSISNITNLQLTLENKSPTGHTHDDRYYTETEMNTKLNEKANTSHTHNDIYYTKDEINTQLGDIETILNEILGV